MRRTQLLRAVHASPGVSRAGVARALGISTGAAAELVADLVAAGLIAEGPAASSAGPGRPTRQLLPSPGGPVVLAVAVTHERWDLEAVAVGGGAVASRGGTHGGAADAVVQQVRSALQECSEQLQNPVAGVGVAVPGLVHDGRFLEATNLGWEHLDLGRVAPAAPVTVVNDASAAAVGEVARGAAAGSGAALHLHLDAGVGGAFTVDGALVGGAHGLAGEFGHMPMGATGARCPCGAVGCWNLSVDAGAVSRLLGERVTCHPVSYCAAVYDRAAAGEPAALEAAREVARSLGRGVAGLVNALDVDRVVLGALAARVLALAPDELHHAVADGLMRRRRVQPPLVVAAALGARSSLVGAAELVWERTLPDL